MKIKLFAHQCLRSMDHADDTTVPISAGKVGPDKSANILLTDPADTESNIHVSALVAKKSCS